jgi:hypothetical protein
MSHIREKADLSMIADQIESAVETILETTPELLKVGRRAQVGRLEDAVRLIQQEVEQLWSRCGHQCSSSERPKLAYCVEKVGREAFGRRTSAHE